MPGGGCMPEGGGPLVAGLAVFGYDEGLLGKAELGTDVLGYGDAVLGQLGALVIGWFCPAMPLADTGCPNGSVTVGAVVGAAAITSSGGVATGTVSGARSAFSGAAEIETPYGLLNEACVMLADFELPDFVEPDEPPGQPLGRLVDSKSVGLLIIE